jgi:ketosteroid isomerase-like protein
VKTEQTNPPDPQLRQQFGAKSKRFNDACTNRDAAAAAAFFTEDAVLVTDTGAVYGRKAIEKSFAALFQKWRVSNYARKCDQYSPHIVVTDRKQMWATGAWSVTVQGQSGGPIQHEGYWTVIREGDDWKIRNLTFNTTPAAAATPSPTASPSDK